MRFVARSAAAGVLVDTGGEVFRRLGVVDAAHYLIRPDGYIGFRAGGGDLSALIDYLGVWLTESRIQNCIWYENTVKAIDVPSCDTAGCVLSVGSVVTCVGAPPESGTPERLKVPIVGRSNVRHPARRRRNTRPE